VRPLMIKNPQLRVTNPADFVRVHGLFIGLGSFTSRPGARRQLVSIHFAKL
jgi:hypothetical protein